MKTGNLLLAEILMGLIFFCFFKYSAFNFIYVGVIGSLILGILIGMIIDKQPEKNAFFSICRYNLVAFTLIFLFTSEGAAALHAGFFYIGPILLFIFIYSLFGAFGAFTTYNMKYKRG